MTFPHDGQVLASPINLSGTVTGWLQYAQSNVTLDVAAFSASAETFGKDGGRLPQESVGRGILGGHGMVMHTPGFVLHIGIWMFFRQARHEMVWPAISGGASSDCWQCGQLNLMSGMV